MPARSSLLRVLSSVLGGCALCWLIASLPACAAAPVSDAGTPSVTDADEAAAARAIEVALGGRSARSRGCTSCHDAGDGRPAGRLLPLPGTLAYPSNLTPDVDTGLGAWTEEQIALAIHDGVDDEGRPLCAVMPRYPHLDPAELHALVAWIRALEPVHREVPPSACGAPDALVLEDQGPGAPDLTERPDLADLAAASPPPDLAVREEPVAPADLAVPADLRASVDQLPAVDLAAPADLRRPTDAGAACGARINEVQTAGAGGATDEFIELVNPCPAPVDLDGIQVVYRAALGMADVVLLRLPVLRLAPAARLLLGSAGFSGQPDLRYGGALSSDGGGLALREVGGGLGDHLGWGTAKNAFVRTTPAPAPPPTLSIGRRPDGADSGDDLRDFRVDVPTPGRANR